MGGRGSEFLVSCLILKKNLLRRGKWKGFKQHFQCFLWYLPFPDKHRKKAKPNDDEDFRNREDKPQENDSTNDDGNQVNFQSNQTNNSKYTLNSNKAAQQTESKPNMVGPAEVKQQPRRVYKFVASNYRFRKKFDVKKWQFYQILFSYFRYLIVQKQDVNCFCLAEN